MTSPLRATPWLAALAAVTAIGLASPTAAADEPPPVRRCGLAKQNGQLAVSVGYRDVFTPEVREKLKSGLTTRIVVQLSVEQDGKKKPVAYWARSIDVAFDLWNEVFVVTVEDPAGRRQARVADLGQAVELAGLLAATPVLPVAGLGPERHRLHFLVEVNPVSKEMVADIRRWLSQPRAVHRGVETQTNFFGSFVGIFVDRRIGQSDRAATFTSQWFTVGNL